MSNDTMGEENTSPARPKPPSNGDPPPGSPWSFRTLAETKPSSLGANAIPADQGNKDEALARKYGAKVVKDPT